MSIEPDSAPEIRRRRTFTDVVSLFQPIVPPAGSQGSDAPVIPPEAAQHVFALPTAAPAPEPLATLEPQPPPPIAAPEPCFRRPPKVEPSRNAWRRWPWLIFAALAAAAFVLIDVPATLQAVLADLRSAIAPVTAPVSSPPPGPSALEPIGDPMAAPPVAEEPPQQPAPAEDVPAAIVAEPAPPSPAAGPEPAAPAPPESAAPQSAVPELAAPEPTIPLVAAQETPRAPAYGPVIVYYRRNLPAAEAEAARIAASLRPVAERVEARPAVNTFRLPFVVYFRTEDAAAAQSMAAALGGGVPARQWGVRASLRPGRQPSPGSLELWLP